MSALNTLTPTPDMDRTVSRRSEPSSRTAFMGEQPNPWDVLPPQVAMSRHRGAKPSRRCELLGKISLFTLLSQKLFIFCFLRFPLRSDYVINFFIYARFLGVGNL